MMKDKLTICFNPWLMFHENDDYDAVLKEIAERGFNCIRTEDGAGLIWDENGDLREEMLISSPFGKFTQYTTYCVIVEKRRLNLLDRLLRICRAAKKYDMKVILSGWFLLHTNWFCEESDVGYIFEMSPAEQIAFFADHLSRILDVLKAEDLIDVVAFAEILNEFDGIPFKIDYTGIAPEDRGKEKARVLRPLHEAAIEHVKAKHPDVPIAFDTWTPWVSADMIPRNIDVFNFHWYYAWPLYGAFQKDIIRPSLDEPEIPAETQFYLRDSVVSVAEILGEMKSSVKTGLDWPRRISLYASIDEEKMDELSKMLGCRLKEDMEYYRSRFYEGVEAVLATHAEVVPHSKIVMGEGVSYCASPVLTFERDSEEYWQLIMEQMSCFHEKGIWGSVVTTTHAPDRNAAWEPCKDLYIQANRVFAEGRASADA